MDFLRNNIFYVILIAVVLLTGGAMAYLYVGKTADYDKQFATRTALESKIKSKKRPVNPKVVEAQRKMVEAIESGGKTVKQRSEGLNRKEPMAIQDLSGQMVPAFPLSTEKFGNIGNLNYAFTEQYIKQLGALVKQLDPTRAPSEVEIIRFIEDSRSAIINQHKAKIRTAEAAGQTPPPPLTQAQVTEKASQQGRISSILSQSSGGAIYADASAFDPIFSAPSTLATQNDLWTAQINLWVQQDIVKAIAGANNEVITGSDAKKKLTVSTALVKRLIKIDVDESYYTGGGPGGGSIGRGGESSSDEGRGGRRGGRGRSSSSFDEEMGSTASPTLTQRVTSPEYDVIHYSFIVIMPTRHIPALEAQLQRLPYHTVLKDSFVMSTEDSQSPYYYGPEPVALVTIEGEMLFLSSWVRPLMPVETLGLLPLEALRPEDQQRSSGPDDDEIY